jgi:hypothetical protein
VSVSIGIPFPSIDPLRFLVDEQIRPFYRDERHDLTASNAPILSTGVYIVHSHQVPKDTVEVVMGVLPHVWARSNPGTANETVALINEVDSLPPAAPATSILQGTAQGWFLWTMLKGGAQPFTVETNYNAPQTQAGASDAQRFVQRGSTWATNDRIIGSTVGFGNPLSTVLVPAGQKFEVTFQLAPRSPTNPIPNPYQIPSPAVPAPALRIDFAGALVFGVTMPQQYYDKLVNARRQGRLGPEAG